MLITSGDNAEFLVVEGVETQGANEGTRMRVGELHQQMRKPGHQPSEIAQDHLRPVAGASYVWWAYW